jgi:hypothetical protein
MGIPGTHADSEGTGTGLLRISVFSKSAKTANEHRLGLELQ